MPLLPAFEGESRIIGQPRERVGESIWYCELLESWICLAFCSQNLTQLETKSSGFRLHLLEPSRHFLFGWSFKAKLAQALVDQLVLLLTGITDQFAEDLTRC